jgi:hypothetical protein
MAHYITSSIFEEGISLVSHLETYGRWIESRSLPIAIFIAARITPAGGQHHFQEHVYPPAYN